MDKQLANQTLSTLDDIAGRLSALAGKGLIDRKVASSVITWIDGFADKFHVAAFGEESLERFKAHVAKVLKKDSDEKYMDTFDNPNKVISGESDEPYMHKVGPSFNAGGIDTFDQDRTTTVTDRKEYAIRDLNEHAGGTKKQPSWSGGPAGKSTKQGATRQASRTPKTWAP